jgi:hypothetical protein
MTKKLEETFNILSADTDDEIVDDDDIEYNIDEYTDESTDLDRYNELLDKVTASLPSIKGLEAADEEFDKLSNDAHTGFNDLMDLGLNVDPRFSAEIFNVASRLLGHAITAKTAKADKKLKSIDLQLKQARLLQNALKNKPAALVDDSIDGTVQSKVYDRNELLAELRAELNNKPK